jgi:phenylacetate-CoA ligase
MGRADQTTKVKGMFVHPHDVAEIARRHPELGRLRLVIRRTGDQDEMVLMAETPAGAAGGDAAMLARVAETLNQVTRLKGAAELAAPGSLPNDGKVIADERGYA